MNIDRQLDLLRQLESSEQWEAAESRCIQLLKHYPRHGALLVEAARMALRRSSPAAAETLLYRALAINPLDISAYIELGMARYEQNDLEDAERYFRKCLLLSPRHVEANQHLGMLLNEQGRFEEAQVFLAEAHQGNPESREASLALADAMYGTGHYQEAYLLYRSIIEQHRNHVDALISMGAVCESLDRMDEALEYLSRARELAPDNPKVYLNLGGVCQRLLRLDEALSLYEKALGLRPGYPTARWNICQIKLLQGHYSEGFSDFDSRFNTFRPVHMRRSGLPQWNGVPAIGKRILVQSEQAFGDTIQFARYIPLLAKQGFHVFFENHLAPLNSLLLSLAGLQGITDGTSDSDCDYSVPLLSLPRLFSTTLDNVPHHVPYMAPPPEKAKTWHARLSEDRNLKVGICWAGRRFPDHRRTIPAGHLAVLYDLTGISWYSLRVRETGEKDENSLRGILPLIDLTDEIDDFSDTAALITGLDLVITIDSAIAHLAGSLAIPTWVLLPFAPDWRWMLERTDSPWYPSVRLFRQPRPGAWAEVVKEVALQIIEIKKKK